MQILHFNSSGGTGESSESGDSGDFGDNGEFGEQLMKSLFNCGPWINDPHWYSVAYMF